MWRDLQRFAAIAVEQRLPRYAARPGEPCSQVGATPIGPWPLPAGLGLDWYGGWNRAGCHWNHPGGQIVAAMPISGAYAEFVCLPDRELIPMPWRLDTAEGVSLILNYITAYQMLHRFAKFSSGQRVLIHGASGGVGTKTCFGDSVPCFGTIAAWAACWTGDVRHVFIAGAAAVSALGGIPIDYQQQGFVAEIQSLTRRRRHIRQHG
jgi:hypothetical protein